MTIEARHERLTHSFAYERMKRVRAGVGRREPFGFEKNSEEGGWYMKCNRCGRQMLPITDRRGNVGYTYHMTELLSMLVGHCIECHDAGSVYGEFSDDYA